MKIDLRNTVTIVAAALLLGLFHNMFSAKSIPLFAFNPERAGLPEESTETIKEPARIGIEEAFNLYDQGVLFIDARAAEDYEQGHIQNAVNIPFDDFDNYRNRLNSIAADEVIVTYCGGTDCDLSIMLGNKLVSIGYQNVYIFFGGWNDWLKEDYPTGKGK